jgi:hypothetical protein
MYSIYIFCQDYVFISTKHVRIILEGKARWDRSGTWLMARDKEMISAVLHEFMYVVCILTAFGDFLWRRHAAVPSAITSTFFTNQRLADRKFFVKYNKMRHIRNLIALSLSFIQLTIVYAYLQAGLQTSILAYMHTSVHVCLPGCTDGHLCAGKLGRMQMRLAPIVSSLQNYIRIQIS